VAVCVVGIAMMLAGGYCGVLESTCIVWWIDYDMSDYDEGKKNG